MATRFYGPGLQKLLARTINGSTAVFKIFPLASGYVFNPDHEFISQVQELSAPGYNGGYGGVDRRTLTWGTSTRWRYDNTTNDVLFDADDVVWTSLPSGAQINHLAIAVELGGNDAASPLIGYVDVNNVTSQGQEIQVAFHPTGILRVRCTGTGAFGQGVLRLLNATIPAGATFKLRLNVPGYTFDPDHTTVTQLGTELSVAGYTPGYGLSGRQSLTGVAWTYDATANAVVFDYDDVFWPGLGVGGTIDQAIVVYEQGGSDATSWPLFMHDPVNLSTNGANVTAVVPPTGAVRMVLAP